MIPFPSTPRGFVTIPSGHALRGRIQLPPSKSVTQRLLNLALLARRDVVLERPLLAADTRLFLAALEQLGCDVRHGEGVLLVKPGGLAERAKIQCGDNGTMLRFLTAALSTLPGEWCLDGSLRLRQRPVGPLVTALTSLGARIEFVERVGFAPLRVCGGGLDGGEVELDARLSSQFASALLMAATRARRETIVRLESPVSIPYLELTRATLGSFGARCQRPGGATVYRVEPCTLKGGRFAVEGDFSAAAYPAAGALLTGGQVWLGGLDAESRQGDRRFLEVLSEMGAAVSWRRREVQVRGDRPLQGVEVDLGDMPDQVPTLAALAPFAEGVTVIRNVGHLRIKESDRLTAMATELRRLGAAVDERPDGLVIEGNWFTGSVPTASTRVETHGDHRVAMSLAVCGLRRPGMVIAEPEVVAKSYPSFWRDLGLLLQK